MISNKEYVYCKYWFNLDTKWSMDQICLLDGQLKRVFCDSKLILSHKSKFVLSYSFSHLDKINKML